MGLTLDMDRVKVVISKHLRNRMRLVDRYNRLLLEGPIREEALKDKGDKRCRPVDNDPVAIQVIFGLTRRIEELDRIEDEKLRATTMVQLYKQLTNLVTAFEAANTRIFTEMWSLVEMHQRQAEQKDKKTLRGLADAGDAELIKLAEDADAKPG